MGITARGAWESVKRHFREMDIDIRQDAVHRRRRRRHVGRRVRQRHAARAHHQAASRHSIIATSSSIPIPIRKAASPSAQRLFDLPRSSWQDYDKELISQGRRHLSARRQENPAVSPRRRSCSARRRQGDAAAGDDARSCKAGRSAVVRRHRHLCARLDETDDEAGDRANDADPHRRRRHPRQGDRRGRQSRHDAARPRRGGAARRAPQHRRDRQFGRRQHLGRRGQHQDRAEPAGARRQADARGAQHASWPR